MTRAQRKALAVGCGLIVLAAAGKGIGRDHEARRKPSLGIKFAARLDHQFAGLRRIVAHRRCGGGRLARISLCRIARQPEQQRRAEEHPQRAWKLEYEHGQRKDQRRQDQDRQPTHARPRMRRIRMPPASSINSTGMANNGHVVALTAGL